MPKKTKFVTLSNSYHGETLGALAIGNVETRKISNRECAHCHTKLGQCAIHLLRCRAFLEQTKESPEAIAQPVERADEDDD